MKMTGYTKLFGSIITSTIWREKNETRILWITMLALKNKEGVVEGSIPGLADMARLSLEDTVAALETLRSPDPYSRTKEHEGRRIEDIDGGWLVLNHAKWRAKMNVDERREYLRIKQQEHRARVNKCKQASTPSTHTEAEADSKAAGGSTVATAWNELPAPFKKIILPLSTGRQTTLRARLANPQWAASWRTALSQLPKSKFLTGQNGRGWVADFEFFIRPDSVTKILEGKYDDAANQRPLAKSSRTTGTANERRIGQYDNVGKV